MEEKTGKQSKYAFAVLVSCVMLAFCPVAMTMGGSGLFFTAVSEATGAGKGMVSMYMTFLSIAALVTLPFIGKLFSKVDARAILTCGVLLVVAGLLLASFTTQVWMFWLAAVIIGPGIASMLFVGIPTIVNRWFAVRSGFYVGIAMAFTGVGGMVWSPVIGSLIQNLGWASAFRVEAVIIAVLTLPFTLFVVRSNPADKGLEAYGADKAAAEGHAAAEGVDASVACKSLSFVLMGIFAFCINLGMYVVLMTPTFVNALPVAAAVPLLGATVYSVTQAGQTIGKVLLGAVGEKSPMAGILIAMGCGIFGLLGYLFLAGSVPGLYASGAVLGVYYATTNVMLPIMTRRLYGTRDYSNIYSRVSMFANLGSILYAIVLGSIFDATGSFPIVFVVVIALFAIAAICGVGALVSGKKLAGKFTAEGEAAQA